MSLKLIFSLILASFLVSSCASISKEECEVGNWAEIGERDSAAGKNKKQYYKYVKDCGKHGMVPSKKDYSSGYETGLKTYCTASNGYEVGRNGKRDPKICPKSLKTAFESSYRKGKSVYDAEKKVKDKANQIEKYEREINELQNSLASGKETAASAALIALKVDKLRLQQRNAEKEKEVLEKELAKIEAE